MDDRIGLGIIALFAVAALAVFGCYSAGIIHGDGDTYSHIVVHTDTGISDVKGEGYCRDGDMVTLSATIKTNYHLLGWFDKGGNKLSANNPYEFVSTDDVDIYPKTEYGEPSKAYHTDGITEVYIVKTVGQTTELKAVVEDGYTFAGWYNVANGKIVNEYGKSVSEYSFSGAYNITVTVKDQADYVAKTTSTKYQGTGVLEKERTGGDPKAPFVWVVTDTETGDYVTSCTATEKISVEVKPGDYTVIISGILGDGTWINERYPITVE